MCTVTWSHDEDGYHLLCNRDEKRTRGVGSAPVQEVIDGVSVIAPRDADFGGSWIAVNEYGVTVTLLNGANLSGSELRRPVRAIESRGQLLLRLASARSVREVCERSARMEFEGYAPFTIAAVEPCEPAAIVEWNGEECAIVLDADRYLPLSSSSYDAEGVRDWRRKELDRIAKGGRLNHELLWAFHESHRGESGAGANAYSPCMHRDDAQTVSFSWITVTPDNVRFFYAPGAPCEARAGELTCLGRVA